MLRVFPFGRSFLKPGERELLGGFSTTIMRGDKVGLIGPNGAGKTTLLRILLGELQPREGTIQLGSKLQVAYFDQASIPMPSCV